MLRRLLPTVLALGLGLAVLVSGLIGLERVFRRERDEARETVESQRQALELYARRVLEQRLDRALSSASAEGEKAARDPLLAADHLLRVEARTQLLPRSFTFRPGSARDAEELFLALSAGDSAAGEPATPWGELLALQRAFAAAVRAGDQRRVESSFRAILRHRSRYRLAADRDLPAMLGLLHFFAREGSPAPELLRALLHDGLDDGRGGRLADLPGLLLEHRERFTRREFLFLSERLIELAAGSGIPYQAFLERSRDASAPRVPLPAGIFDFEAGGPTLVDGGRWLARLDTEGLVVGVAIDLRQHLEEIAADMRQRGLLRAEEEIRADMPPRHQPLAELELRLESERWPRLLAGIERRHRLKAALILLSATLALAMAVLALHLQARRVRLLELRSELLATVSHELKTPLASVRLLAETVARRSRTPELKDYPQRMVREIDRLNFLVENILSFNRLEKGRFEPRFSRLSLAELIDDVRSEIEHPNCDLVLEAPSGELVADPELMRLLLSNLVRNACVHNDRDPVVSIDHRRLAGGVEILVRDNGRGIPESERQKIFDDFYRPPDSAGVGTGLGLAICRRIVELHRGTIRIASSGPEGTTFRLEFPLLEGQGP